MGRSIAKYSDELKDRALHLVDRVGSAQTSVDLDIPLGTLQAWVSQRRTVERAIESSETGPPSVAVVEHGSWLEVADRAGDEAGRLARDAIATSQAYLLAGRIKEAESAGNLASRMIEKANLLTGGYTDRSESRSMSLSASLDTIVKLAQMGTIPGTDGFPIRSDTPPDLPIIPWNHPSGHLIDAQAALAASSADDEHDHG